MHFLTSCHATPFQSYMHLGRRVVMRNLDCSPLAMLNCSAPTTESSRFQAAPLAFVESFYAASPTDAIVVLPRFVVMFDSTSVPLAVWLASNAYSEKARFFHSHLQGDADAVVRHDGLLIFER